MTTRTVQSECRRLGQGRLDTGVRAIVFAAVEPLPCEQCGRTLAAGERFTRKSLAKRVWSTDVYCTTCRPCRLDPGVEAVLRLDPATLITFAEVAALAGVTWAEVATLCDAAAVPVRFVGGRVHFERAAVLAALGERRRLHV